MAESQRVAVDAMGGDHGPAVIVAGALDGARAMGVALNLVGRGSEIEQALAALDPAGVSVQITDAPDVITMDDHPAQAVRRKPLSSIVVGLREVKAGRSSAFVSAGNSGAVMAAALMILGRVPGIDRPAIASFLPSLRSRTLVLDLGAVTDPKPQHLVQFAQMGHVYAQRVMGIDAPTIGLLSNGEEPTKGNQLVQEVFPLLQRTPGITFHGNVEGRDVTQGVVDVIVTDGFTGNVALKVAEGVAGYIGDLLRAEVTATLPRKLAAALLRPAFRTVRAKLDYSEIGGAPLLGIDGTVIIAHGRSDAKAIRNAMVIACRAHTEDLPGAIRAALVRPPVPEPIAVEPATLPEAMP